MTTDRINQVSIFLSRLHSEMMTQNQSLKEQKIAKWWSKNEFKFNSEGTFLIKN